MTTTVVKTIGSGGDYTSIQAWNDAAPASLVTADQVWQGNCLAGFNVSGGSSTVVTIGGSTSDSTRYKLLTTASGASFRDNANIASNALRFNSANGVSISASTSYNAPVVAVNEAYARVSKLQLQNLGTGSSPVLNVTAANVRIDGCIIEGNGSSYSGSPLHVTGANVLVTNSLVVNRRADPFSTVFFEGPSSGTLVNCTLVVPSDKGPASVGLISFSYSSGIVAKNCAMFGGPAVSSSTTSRITFTTCENETASPPTGVTQVAYDTTTGSGFQATTDAARDFRIKSTSAMKDAGTTDSTNAPVDIAGTSRPAGSAYDIGAWEYAVAPFAAVFSSSSTLTANLTTGRVPLNPAWATNAIGVAKLIPGTLQTGTVVDTHADGGIGVDKRIAFSGMAMAGPVVVLAACGGHTDYHGNEVVKIDLSADSPAWVLATASSSPEFNPLVVGDGVYAADGKPAAAHTYWQEEYVAQTDRVYRMYTHFAGDGAINSSAANAWHLSTNTWDAAGTVSSGTETSCLDDYGNLWAHSTDGNLYRYNAAANLWTTIGATGLTDGSSPMVYDPVRARLLVLAWGNGQSGTGPTTFYALSTTNGSAIAQTVNASATYTAWQALNPIYASFVHDPWNDRFLFFSGNDSSTIFVLTPPVSGTAWDMTTLSITGATFPACVGGGSYNRFRVSKDLQGIVYMPAGNQSMVFVRLAGAASGALSGTVAATQQPNTATASGAVGVTGTAAASEAKNTASATGSVVVAGTAATTQQGNVAAAAGQVAVSGVSAPAQTANVASVTGGVVIAGTAASSQAANTAAASGATGVTGTLSSTQNPNTAALTGSVTAAGSVTGTIAANQAPNVAALAGNVAADNVSGTVASVQQPNTSTAVGAVAVQGAVAVTAARQVMLAIGQVFTGGVEVATHGFTAVIAKRIWRAIK